MDIKLKKFKRKAVLFSLISVLFSVLFVTIFSQNFKTTYEDRIPGSNIRIKVMDTYVRNFETYLGDSIKISTYRTLDAITNIKHTERAFFTDEASFNTTFSECMKCGYTNCVARVTECNLQYYLEARLNNITNLSDEELNIKTTYKINSIKIEHESAFNVRTTVNISYNVTDDSEELNYARWNKNIIVEQSVSIIGLLDPIGNINDGTNTYNRTIKEYTGTCQGDPSCWDPTNTEEFYEDMSFTLAKDRGISFLQRYWNDTTPSKYGIETIIHPTELPSPDGNNSFIDRRYWNNTFTCNYNPGMSISIYVLDGEYVSLDSNSSSWYGLTVGDMYGIVCPRI